MNLVRSIFGRVRRNYEIQDPRGVLPNSGDFIEVTKESITDNLKTTWKDPLIPQRQFEECTLKEIANYKRGIPVEPFDVFVTILKDNIAGLDKKTVLEIGCSSGYYSEVLKIKGIRSRYSGCDFSESFIRFARERYPGVDFLVQDSRALSYPDGSFDIVVSGCCLLHILEYEEAISETARAAREYVVFHRTPVLHRKATSYYLKTAYGIKMFEIHFNERELFRLMRKYGLAVLDIVTFNASLEKTTGDVYAYKTYLCRKT